MTDGAITRVGVVVLNHDGGSLTLDCLRSVLASEWPAEQLRVVLVDNASRDQSAPDGVVATVRRELPTVDVIESPTNTGYAGGMNLGIRALLADPERVDAIALLNNDATVTPGWLGPLAAALDADPGIGAACPKILFAGRFVELALDVTTTTRGRGDARELGVRIDGARVDDEDVWARAQLVDGFWGRELDRDPGAPPGAPTGEWTAAHATLRVPVAPTYDGHADLELRLRSESPATLRVVSGGVATTLDVTTDGTWHRVAMAGDAIDVVNNVGTEVRDDGYGADRGYLQPDDGRFDEPVPVFAWCGAAVLLRREYLEDVGLLDERLFLYYEDLELAWRGREHGWRYRLEPASVVRHVHAASSGEGSALKDHYDERNRLLVLTRHRGIGAGARAAGRHLLVTASYARRDVVSPLLRGERPNTAVIRRRLRALGAFAARAAAMRKPGPSESSTG